MQSDRLKSYPVCSPTGDYHHLKSQIIQEVQVVDFPASQSPNGYCLQSPGVVTSCHDKIEAEGGQDG